MEEDGWGIPPLDLDGSGSLPHRIARSLRGAIREGRFPPGSRLPSTRRLADALGHSRPVVVAAYEQLRVEGWIRTRVGAGTFVCPDLAPPADSAAGTSDPPTRSPPSLSRFGRRILSQEPVPLHRAGPGDPSVIDLRAGSVDRDAFPWVAWRRLTGRVYRREERWRGIYDDPAGARELRELLVTYLARQRGVRASTEQVMVVSGSQQALSLVASVLVDPGSAVALEHPCYPGAAQLFSSFGARLRPVPLDGEALDPSALPSAGGDARLLYLTPSHQFPAGGTLAIDRRLAVLRWAKERDALVVEDDYDGEFRFGDAPIPSLQGQDDDGRVIYVGSFSKVLLPELRLGYLVVPSPLLDVFRRAKWLQDRHTPRLEQLAAAEFIRRGEFGRHLRRLRRRLAERRRRLEASLEETFGDDAIPLGEPAGMHLMVRFPRLAAEGAPALARAAATRDVLVSVGDDCYLEDPPGTELILGYGGPLEPDDLPRAAEALALAYREVS